jgi:hypothetical protein
VEIDEKVVAVRSNVIVNDTIINAIIDTGAALNIITSKLLDTLGLEIEESSKTRFIIANGEKQASLGKTQIDIEINDWIISTNVEVIESRKKELLLGTQFLAKMDGMIDLEKRQLTLKTNDGNIITPIYYTQKEMTTTIPQDISESDESEESDEYSDEYEEFDEEIELNEILGDDNSEENNQRNVVKTKKD